MLTGNINEFPPAINLTTLLIKLGHNVTVVANGADEFFSNANTEDRVDTIELGGRKTKTEKVKQLFNTRKRIRDFIHRSEGGIDLYWCMTDLTAREAGSALNGKKYVMNISELVEYVPLLTARPMVLHSKKTVRLARNAAAVVCPEYNRAHIQKVWWDLPRVPFVLPNKPCETEDIPFRSEDRQIRLAFEGEERKILLYQGVFSSDRSFSAYSKALEILGHDYCLYLMGMAMSAAEQRKAQQLAAASEQIELIDFVPAPYHLAYTSFGHIGLLPYKPSKGGRCSCLNALYCAPNKIWEYARVGLPMIGSDVPALKHQLESNGAGFAINMDDPNAIVDAIRTIADNYDKYSSSSRRLYDSYDSTEIVREIIDYVCEGESSN